MKRSPMKRTAMRRKPTQRKAEGDAEFIIERDKRMVRAQGRCERCKVRAATAGHHVIRRSHHLLHNVENLRVLCLDCHEWVHTNVGEAKRLGWIATDWPQIEPRQTA